MEILEKPVLFVVATPIGNLQDVSERCLEVLQHCDLIAAEDTRVVRKLLNAKGIGKKELISYYDQVEQQRCDEIIGRMVEEKLVVALVSDAGTPCIADPGFRIVAAAHAAGIKVSPIPGPSSLTALVSASGLPNSRVLFVGFLPTKASAIEAEIASWRTMRASVVFFESMRRLPATLQKLAQEYPRCRITIGRELTKIYEEVLNTPVEAAIEWASKASSAKGEGAVMVDLTELADAGEKEAVDELREKLRVEASKAFGEGLRLRDLLNLWQDRGLARGELYDLLLAVKEGHSDKD